MEKLNAFEAVEKCTTYNTASETSNSNYEVKEKVTKDIMEPTNINLFFRDGKAVDVLHVSPDLREQGIMILQLSCISFRDNLILLSDGRVFSQNCGEWKGWYNLNKDDRIKAFLTHDSFEIEYKIFEIIEDCMQSLTKDYDDWKRQENLKSIVFQELMKRTEQVDNPAKIKYLLDYAENVVNLFLYEHNIEDYTLIQVLDIMENDIKMWASNILGDNFNSLEKVWRDLNG